MDVARGGPGFWRALLARHAQTRAESPAVSQRCADGSFLSTSYRSLAHKAFAYARRFLASTAPEQPIPLCLARGDECAAAMLGALCAGRAFCCLNPKLRLPQLEVVFAQLASPLALVDGAGLAMLRGERASDSPLHRCEWLMVPGAPLPRLAKRVCDELARQARVSFFEPPSEAEAPTIELPGSALGCCLFTSGSTGTPKGVLISSGDLAARARIECAWFELQASDVLLNILPFSFDVGLNQLLSSVLVGAELLVLDSWLPADILATVASRRVTGIAAVPSIWADFIAHDRRFERAAAHASLRFITLSGGDLSPAQHARLPALCDGARVFKTYGQTEAFRIACLPAAEYAQHGLTVGRALPEGHLYVVRPDLSRCAAGETGEVVYSGVGTMLGYLAGGHEDKLRPNPFRGPEDPNALAVFSGDLGTLDAAGRLRLEGRRDDLVKIQGNRVYPSEVKALLTTIDGVAAAEVVALRQAEQTLLAAFVVLRPETTLAVDALRRALAERAPSYMVPTLLLVRDELPRTASGKPDRETLTAEARAALA